MLSSSRNSEAQVSPPDWLSASIQAARLTVAVGESLPVPYVKGLALVILELLSAVQVSEVSPRVSFVIYDFHARTQAIKKNQSDLKELVTRVVDILKIVRDTMVANGEVSGERCEKICIDFQGYVRA